ncbi:unnamed protein product [Rotaria magnacalcarata]|uniref:Uncharacterized protein n=3 Tax=Rotaria magnacalcarata TaxID=392030 RepID=A0A815Y5F5_9BILA|nr:unnamed protein product [Rotaria magnacalcarata]CAF4078225.1 unnamed protein product [Rotaria magnacalcarata]
MTNNLKKDHLKTLDLPLINGKSNFYMNHDDDDDDQDIYISERSSMSSSNDMNTTSSQNVKRLPTPTPTPTSLLSLTQKQSYNLRYHCNEFPDSIMPTIAQYKLLRKEEKKRKNTPPKGPPPGQTVVASFSETKSPELKEEYCPYRCYYRVKNPDWTMTHRQASDAQLLMNDSLDSSQYAQQPVLMTSPIKPKQQPRKSRANGVSTLKTNQDKQRHDQSEKASPTSSYLTFNENLENPHYHHHHHHYQQQHQQQHIGLENSDNDEYREQLPKRTTPMQRRKLKIEHDSNDHYVPMHPNKSPRTSNNLIITSNSLTKRSKNQSKMPEKSPVNADTEENSRHRPTKPHHHHYPSPSPPPHPHHHHHQNLVQSHISPSIPSQQNYQHHQHLHIRRRPPSGSNVTSEMSTVDSTVKKSDRPTYFQQPRDSFHSPATPVYNQSSYLPPIIRDNHHHHHQKTNTTRFPTEYYGTIARQTQSKDWEESIEIPKVYKNDPQTRFYDRYLNTVVDKRLAAN